MCSMKSKVIMEDLSFSNGVTLEILYRGEFDKRYPHIICRVNQPDGPYKKLYYIQDKKLTLEEAKEWCIKAAIDYFEEKQKFYLGLKETLIQESKK